MPCVDSLFFKHLFLYPLSSVFGKYSSKRKDCICSKEQYQSTRQLKIVLVKWLSFETLNNKISILKFSFRTAISKTFVSWKYEKFLSHINKNKNPLLFSLSLFHLKQEKEHKKASYLTESYYLDCFVMFVSFASFPLSQRKSGSRREEWKIRTRETYVWRNILLDFEKK